ncbi:unnamed protein product [Cuscuta europaea]|uniref:Cytochrome P450 n=1 Tax=Cuscuta europaea TaxID=41803 RepID=A0A9P0YRY7_CUSEU|nr:unnamed protein product [Cuscuta europaea]
MGELKLLNASLEDNYTNKMILHIIILSSSSLALIFLLLIRKQSSENPKPPLPPSPKRLPIIGHLHHLIISKSPPHRSLHRLSDQYGGGGGLMFLQLGSVPALVVSSADAVREIFRDHDVVFSGRPAPYAARKMTYNYADVTFSTYGEYWREVRKVLVVQLLSAKRVQGFVAVREAEVGRMIDRIAFSCSESAAAAVDLSESAIWLSNNVICRVALGKKRDGGGEMKFHGALLETQQLLGEPNLADFFPGLSWVNKVNGFDARVEKNFKELDGFLNEVLEEHCDNWMNDEDDADIVQSLLRIQKDQNFQTSISFTTKNIKAVLVDVFIAGSDTSASTIVWTMTELIKNPNTMRKAQSEVRNLMKGNQKVSESDLPNLKYLKMVVKESLRLHPPAPLLVPRETTEKCTLGGYDIPAKTRVFINAMSIGTDPMAWENPMEFWPERFFESDVDYRGMHSEFIPFGAGRRGCPGTNFSVPLVELTLANLLYRFDWKLPEGMAVEEIDMEETFGITVHKKAPLSLLALIISTPTS